MADLTVIGGGLAGSEAAWQVAQSGLSVDLYEMRPSVATGAHLTGFLGELVCSNSLGSNLVDRSSGLLKEEVRLLGSMLLQCAEETAIPAGAALAVDRELFARRITDRISQHPRIRIIREEVKTIPEHPVLIASGPLTSPSLSRSIQEITGQNNLYFYDAVAPIVRLESINMEIAFRASRFTKDEDGEGDYINCPLNSGEYSRFINALLEAERIQLQSFEQDINLGVTAGASEFFEGCLPIEVIATRGSDSLAFGPMRPIGLFDPRTGRRPHAVVQLRQDNIAGSLYNLVGFQTNLTFAEQKRILHLIPGLENAEFERFGQMHRNTFIASPLLLNPTMQFRSRADLFWAGQITGIEGYMGNIATGVLAGLNASRFLQGDPLLELPISTMLGALTHYVTHASLKDFQPMKANFGILPPIEQIARGKRERAAYHVLRALTDLKLWADSVGFQLSSLENQ
jgi:methylenetetrahydrofolate--tRNA-(uracil-5-)-methyltransferase